MNKFPTSLELESTMIRILRDSSSGPLSSAEIDSAVAIALGISPETLAIIHSGNRSEFAYRMAWVRSKAKKKNLITKDEITRGWQLV